jgi:hypothetical protein
MFDKRALPLNHLIALSRQTEQGEGQEIPLDRGAEPHLVFARNIIAQVIAGKVRHMECAAAIAGLPQREHRNLRHGFSQLLADQWALCSNQLHNPAFDFLKVGRRQSLLLLCRLAPA